MGPGQSAPVKPKRMRWLPRGRDTAKLSVRGSVEAGEMTCNSIQASSMAVSVLVRRLK